MVLEDRALGRFNKCVGQVEDIWRITIKDDNGVLMSVHEVCRMSLFDISYERLLTGRGSGDGEDVPSRMPIINAPRSVSGVNRAQYVSIDKIWSACVILPRVRVPASPNMDLKYHVITLRRQDIN